MRLCIYLVQFSIYGELFVESDWFLRTPPVFGALVGGDPVQILPWSLASEIYRVPGLSFSIICVILCSAILIQYRSLTDIRRQHIPS